MPSFFAGLIFALGLVTTAAAQEPHQLSIATFVTPKHGMSQWLEQWAAGLEKASAGQLRFEILHGAQMGPPPRYYDIAANGQADITWILHGATPGRFPLTELSHMPFLFCSAEQATRVLNDPKLRADYLDAEHRGVKVLLMFMHPPGQINMKSAPILALEDFSGKALRPASQAVGRFVSLLGGVPVGLPPTAMAEALQKGTIDGTMIDYGGAALGFQLGPFLSDITEVYAYSNSFALVMNPNSFDALPEELQKLINDSVEHVAGDVGKIWDQLDAIGRARLQREGVSIHTMSTPELNKIKAKGDELIETYQAELEADGLNGTAVLDRMRALRQSTGAVGPGCR